MIPFLTSLCRNSIAYLFHALFFLVPLVFSSQTSELFELNKIWLTYTITILVAVLWITKMILQKQLRIQRTPLDIPIALFFISQTISTLFSLDLHTSLWGYYSRFNGGWYSTLTYVFLYYAFVSNMERKDVFRVIWVSMFSGLFVILWGLPSHFGGDPTCYLFRGSFDVSCWTEAFHPKVRIFSTLGQPDWIAAYIAILLPVAITLYYQTQLGVTTIRIFATTMLLGLYNFMWILPLTHMHVPSAFFSFITGKGLPFNGDPTCILYSTFTKPGFVKEASCDAHFLLQAPFLKPLAPLINSLFSLTSMHVLTTIAVLLLTIAILLPLFRKLAYIIGIFEEHKGNKHYKPQETIITKYSQYVLDERFSVWVRRIAFFLLATLFYLALMYSGSKSAFIGFWIANAVFWAAVFVLRLLPYKEYLQTAVLFTVTFLAISFFIAQPIPQLNPFTYQEVSKKLMAAKSQQQTAPTAQEQTQQVVAGELGGTDSGEIRLIVWEGAIAAWKAKPIFGYGVETFAFAYYRHRPAAHNLTSEWDYLYNKAHNEYLNYLATTGAVGLGTYLLLIGWFLWTTRGIIGKKQEHHGKDRLLSLGLLAGYGTILATNFFGFSVVIVNLYFFLIPAFFYLLYHLLPEKVYAYPTVISEKTIAHKKQFADDDPSIGQWLGIGTTAIVSLYLLWVLFAAWTGDTYYSLGTNYNRVREYQTARQYLLKALEYRTSEPMFYDELALATAYNAYLSALNKDENTARAQIQEAIRYSDQVIRDHPNNIVFWKTRVKIFVILGQLNPQFLTYALQAVQKAHTLAPTDARIGYSLGVLYSQNNDNTKALETLDEIIKLKPNYRDAYYAKAVIYRGLAVNKDGKVVNTDMQKKAVENVHVILEKIIPNDGPSVELLKQWGEKIPER